MPREIFLDVLLHQNYSLRSVIKSSLSPFRANNANANNSMRSKLIVFKPKLTDYLFLTVWPWLALLPSNSSVQWKVAHTVTIKYFAICSPLSPCYGLQSKPFMYVTRRTGHMEALYFPSGWFAKVSGKQNHCVWFCWRPCLDLIEQDTVMQCSLLSLLFPTSRDAFKAVFGYSSVANSKFWQN